MFTPPPLATFYRTIDNRCFGNSFKSQQISIQTFPDKAPHSFFSIASHDLRARIFARASVSLRDTERLCLTLLSVRRAAAANAPFSGTAEMERA
jgi:hypothetical protein